MLSRTARKKKYKMYDAAFEKGCWIDESGESIPIKEMPSNRLYQLMKFIFRSKSLLSKDTKMGYIKAIKTELEIRNPKPERKMPSEYEGLSDSEKIEKFLKEKGATKLDAVEPKEDTPYEHRFSKKSYTRLQFEKYEEKGLDDFSSVYDIGNIKPRETHNLIGKSIFVRGSVRTITSFDFVLVGGKMYNKYILDDNSNVTVSFALKNSYDPSTSSRSIPRQSQSFVFEAFPQKNSRPTALPIEFSVVIPRTITSYEDAIREAVSVFVFDYIATSSVFLRNYEYRVSFMDEKRLFDFIEENKQNHRE